jgi:hypothetical protein
MALQADKNDGARTPGPRGEHWATRDSKVGSVADPSSRWSRRPSNTYSRMFTALAAGGFLVVTGSIGWNVSYLHGFFEGGRWVDGPIWWQIALGVGLLLLGVYWSRRLES